MINKLNLYIFDYIFSINEDIREGLKQDENQYRNELNQKIKQISELEDFWEEYKYYFNDNCVMIAKTLGGSIVRYNNFPRFKIETKKEYLNTKLNEIKNSIEDNGSFVISEIKNILNNVENMGKKTILDYCEQNGIIKYKGKVFIEADDSPSYAIIYDNIDAVVNDEKGDLFIPNLVQNIFNGNNYGTVNQTNNIDNLQDKFFDIVLEKLDVMKIESKLDDKKIKEIQECCRKKDKNKVISFLKEIAMGTGTNLIATGILAMFGLM